MAEQKYYIGSHGPYYYDDADSVDDPDGDFSGESRQAFRTAGQISVGTAPSDDEEIVRKKELDEATSITVLTSLDDVDSVSDGWYKWTTPAPSNAPFDNAIMYQLSDGSYPIQIAWGNKVTGKIAVRRKDAGVWYTWTTFVQGSSSITSSFLTADGKEITVTGGVITAITDKGYSNIWKNI